MFAFININVTFLCDSQHDVETSVMLQSFFLSLISFSVYHTYMLQINIKQEENTECIFFK